MVDSVLKLILFDVQVVEWIMLLFYDFFIEQVIKEVDVYFFCWIFYNYLIFYVFQIFCNFVFVFKLGVCIIINDYCLFEGLGQEDFWDEKVMCCMDVVMFSLFNVQECIEFEFRELFVKVGEGN